MGASLSNIDMSTPQPTWLGNWNSSFGDSKKTSITIIEKNNGFAGTYPYKNGKLEAKIDQKNGESYLEGYWMQNDGTGWFRFKLSDDGQSFYGEWGRGADKSIEGYWNGTRPN